jgi:predicted enzyme related to lactoylglutathione lyase
MDRSVEFYQNILGLELLFKRDDWSEFEIDGQRIALHKSDVKTSNGGAVISFHAEPIEGAIETLKGKGVCFVEELQVYPYGKIASFLDPDGNIIGLYQPPAKSNK